MSENQSARSFIAFLAGGIIGGASMLTYSAMLPEKPQQPNQQERQLTSPTQISSLEKRMGTIEERQTQEIVKSPEESRGQEDKAEYVIQRLHNSPKETYIANSTLTAKITGKRMVIHTQRMALTGEIPSTVLREIETFDTDLEPLRKTTAITSREQERYEKLIGRLYDHMKANELPKELTHLEN